MTSKPPPDVIDAEFVEEPARPGTGPEPLTILGMKLRPKDEQRLREIGGAAVGAFRGASAIGDFFRVLGNRPRSGIGVEGSASSSAPPDGGRRRPMPGAGGSAARARRGG